MLRTPRAFLTGRVVHPACLASRDGIEPPLPDLETGALPTELTGHQSGGEIEPATDRLSSNCFYL